MSRYKDTRKAYIFFNRIALIEDEIKIKQEQIKCLRDVSSNGEQERVQSSNASDTIGNCVIKIEGIKNKINKDIEQLIETKDETFNTINKLKDLELQQVMWYRYIQKYEFSKIAKEMDISERTIYRLHNKGIKKINEILKLAVSGS